MSEVVIVGSMATDTIETPFKKVSNVLGGSATYASYAASFFCKPGIVAVVGNDFSKDHLSLLTERDISLDGLKIDPAFKTFHWEGSYEYDMNEAKTLRTELNVLETFKAELPAGYKNAKYLFLGNIDPELQLNVIAQMNDPKFIIADTMNFWIQHKKQDLEKVIKKVDMLLINDGEARQFFGTTNLVKAARMGLKMGLGAIIIKKGEHGALLFTRSGYFATPGYPLENVVDPTGCGDSFGGALTGYLAKSDDMDDPNLKKAVIYGSVLASFNAEDFSLERMKKLKMSDIEGRYQEFRAMREF